MLVNAVGHQPALLQKAIRPREIRHVNRNVVTVVVGDRRALAKDQALVEPNPHPRGRPRMPLLETDRRIERLRIKSLDLLRAAGGYAELYVRHPQFHGSVRTRRIGAIPVSPRAANLHILTPVRPAKARARQLRLDA